jgi:fused signal recognition particle receptor
MFGKLKEKLKSWTQGLLKKTEEVPSEEVEEVEEELKEIPKEKPEKKEKESKKEKEPEKEKPKEEKISKKEKKSEEKTKKKEKESKKEKEPEKELILPEIEETETITEIIEEKTEISEEEIPKEEGKEKKGFFQKIFSKDKEKVRKIEEHEYVEPKKKVYDEKEREVSDKIIEDIKHEEKGKGFFQKIFAKVVKVKVSEKEFEIYSEELEMLLLENNVALEVAEKIIRELKEKIVGKEFLKKEIEGQIEETLKDIIYNILIEPFNLIHRIQEKKEFKHKPYVILFCGINGTGKTTTIAKIAQMLKDKGLSSIFAAGDTFRAASIEQIKKHGDKLGIKVISHEYGSDPAAVGFDAIKYAEKNHVDVVMIDTAGRMHTEKNLMAQIEKITKVCKPDTKIFVGESITGNDIIEQVKAFDSAVHIDGIILTKVDIDEKGGTALSVGYITKRPILFLGIGQEYDKIELFDKNKFVKNLGL